MISPRSQHCKVARAWATGEKVVYGWKAERQVLSSKAVTTVIAAAFPSSHHPAMLVPYWIKTERPMSLGYGVTARSPDDATVLLREAVAFTGEIIRIVAITDMREIDQGHVAPNMGNWMCRGIWFPQGLS